jgi:hypothetical protein
MNAAIEKAKNTICIAIERLTHTLIGPPATGRRPSYVGLSGRISIGHLKPQTVPIRPRTRFLNVEGLVALTTVGWSDHKNHRKFLETAVIYLQVTEYSITQ